jgi:NCAIR mutase (PurE)-related protein
MDNRLRAVLKDLSSKKLTVEDALGKLRDLPFEDLGFARVDHHRALRQGIPEVVFAMGKRPVETIAIARAIYKKNGRLLITKATNDVYEKLGVKGAVFHETSGVISAGGKKRKRGCVLVLSAGTSDIPVADEAAHTASFLGSRVRTVYDVGVAGIHRLIQQKEAMEPARAVVVAAGMEGALPSVVGGLTDKPIIAVPTSVGYGTSLGGLTALFAMLNSCVPGIAVMNIDNGFGAGCLAHKINTL